MEGIKGYLNEAEYSQFTMEEMALAVIDEMKDMVRLLFPKMRIFSTFWTMKSKRFFIRS